MLFRAITKGLGTGQRIVTMGYGGIFAFLDKYVEVFRATSETIKEFIGISKWYR